MSSLTNLFTSLANKIRSKTGSEATMTPYEMVNAIDDVYAKGVIDGTTPTQTKTVTATTSAQTVTPDSGYALSSVTVNPQVHSGTYTPSSRSAALDMGVNNNNRYVNTNSVPNTNSGTYTYPWSGGETVDLGAANTYRYVNAQSVYSAGYSNGVTAGKAAFNTTLTVYLSGSSSSRPSESGKNAGLQIVGSATYQLVETANIKVATYSASGVSVTKSGSVWVCTNSYSGSGIGYANGNYATASSANGWVTFTLTITPP